MNVRAIVLAAGKGTRMKSGKPKVLHDLCGRPLLWHVLQALRDAGVDDILVVSSPELDAHLGEFGVTSIVQEPQLGTGHAVQVALQVLDPRADGRIIVCYGDMPLVPPGLLEAIAASVSAGGTPLSMVTAKMPLPSSFGRVIREDGGVKRVVEVKDASAGELEIDEMNAGVYAFEEAALRDGISQLRDDNAQKEYYLTDMIEVFSRAGKRVTPVVADEHAQVAGVNDRAELAVARKEMNARLCAAHMRDGVTIVDPDTTYLEPELSIGRDTVIYPNSTIGRLSEIGARCVVGPNARLSNAKLGENVTARESVIVDCTIGNDVAIGPFAHLRGRTVLSDGVHIGNFVEVKNSRLGAGAKASHLSYLGDATVGEGSNIGAGTITCNYDGQRKNETKIGKNVFIGSNSSLIAPVTIGDGALTGASSVVTKDVPPNGRVAGNPAKPLPPKTSQ